MGPQFLERVGAPKKWPIWGGKKILWTLPKKVHVGNGYEMCFLKKNWKKICQIWPRRPLKHFTAAYRGFPPCTQSQPPINRETGYSNVLGHHGHQEVTFNILSPVIIFSNPHDHRRAIGRAFCLVVGASLWWGFSPRWIHPHVRGNMSEGAPHGERTR